MLFLRQIYPEDVKQKAADPDYVQRLGRVLARFDAYMQGADAAREIGPGAQLDAQHPVGYFSAEFGVHESLRIYSGGLGILAGDHLKSASDLGLPLVAVGLFYRYGYFQQKLTSSGEQQHVEIENDPRNLPLEPVLDEQGRPLELRLQLPSSELVLRAWKVAVGRVLSLPARQQRAREPARGSRHHAHALRRRPREPPAPGDRARPRRQAPAGAALDLPGRVPHQRGPRGLPGGRARLRAWCASSA